MNYLVKILIDDNGEEISDPKWCFIYHEGGNMSFCDGQYFGEGESAVVYETKSVNRGGITCENCLSKIKEVKSVKL